jgi:nicotinate-nucleotide pyrophosphorylase (carboxylating)
MDPDEVERCVTHADSLAPAGRRALLEVSGGITLETVGTYAVLGIDCISVGAITNSAPVLDIGLDISADGVGEGS